MIEFTLVVRPSATRTGDAVLLMDGEAGLCPAKVVHFMGVAKK